MARNATSLEEERNAIRRRYKDGNALGSQRKHRKITDESEMDASTLEWKKAHAVFLKSADYSYRYISDNLRVQTSVIKKWFAEDKNMAERVAKLQADMIDGGVKLLKSYVIEAIEMLMEIARHTGDDEIARKCLNDILDRAGMSKVSKTESQVTKREEVDLSDNFFSRIEALPLETQMKIAELMQEVETVMVAAKGQG